MAARQEALGEVVKKPFKKWFGYVPLWTEQEEQEHALFDAVMGVFERMKPTNITVVRTMMKIAISAAIYGGGNADGFVADARKSFDEAMSKRRNNACLGPLG